MPIFRYPFFYNPNYYNKFYNQKGYKPTEPSILQNKTVENTSTNLDNNINCSSNTNKQNTSINDNNISQDYFFELFGLKLYSDDVLLMCLIFFLYEEGVKDDELFLSLILLLLS